MRSSPEERSLVSLFCGAGGLDEGFSQAGFKTRLAYDIESSCVNTIQHNHDSVHAFQRDLSSIEVEEIIDHWEEHGGGALTGLLGGPPCQSFSRSNVYKSDNDPRDTLPRHYARILDGLNRNFGLDFFVFENVPGLVEDEDFEALYRDFKNQATEAGFLVSEGRLDAQYFGVPQTRERVFVVGLNEEQYSRKFRFPRQDKTQTPRTVKQAIGDLPDPVYYNKSLTPEDIEEQAGHPNHWCMYPRSDKFNPDNDFLEPGNTDGRSFRTLEWGSPSYTVAYGNREMHIHPSCERRVSIFEAMRFQGFPDRYELRGNLSEQSDMISDAVAPPVAEALARAIKAQIYENAIEETGFEEQELIDVKKGDQLSFTKEL